MALSIIVSTKDFAAHAGKSPVAGWLVGRGRAHSATEKWLSQVGPPEHQMSSVMLPGEEEVFKTEAEGRADLCPHAT